MKKNYSFRFPEESILGFKILSSIQSTISAYFLLVSGWLLNPYFGTSNVQIKAGSIFNIILNLSLMVLIINLIRKRNQLKRKYFILINSIIFIFMPYIFFKLFANIKILLP
tara:strand:+ start:627 stop:959 length:333 start_codon:yes stop_codon:yes gene_type:complete